MWNIKRYPLLIFHISCFFFFFFNSSQCFCPANIGRKEAGQTGDTGGSSLQWPSASSLSFTLGSCSCSQLSLSYDVNKQLQPSDDIRISSVCWTNCFTCSALYLDSLLKQNKAKWVPFGVCSIKLTGPRYCKWKMVFSSGVKMLAGVRNISADLNRSHGWVTAERKSSYSLTVL